MIDLRLTLLCWGLMAAPFAADARPPLSASDWLSGSVDTPSNRSAWRPGDPARPQTRPNRSDLAKSGAVEPVGVTRLGQENPDAKGTVSARTAGLPPDLWGNSDGATLAGIVRAQNPQLPAMRRLLRRVLAAQLAPPNVLRPEDGGALYLARVDKLLDLGATGAAQELLLTAGPNDPERFRRLFDIALLSGDEARACDIMNQTPGVAPSFAARVFCLAMGGDWPAAAVVFTGAETLGRLDPETATLMAHFLDDSFTDSRQTLDAPATVTPLTFRLHAAIGQPLATGSLPLAFTLSDLDMNSGWKAQLDAAERLARVGAIPASHLREIYILQKPAASGGVWDRTAAVQKLVEGLALRDKVMVEAALPVAFDAMNSAGLGYALADIAGAESAAMELPGRAGVIAMWLALAANQSHIVEILPEDASEFDRWLVAFASGKTTGKLPANDPQGMAAVLAPVFQGKAAADLSPSAAGLIAAGQQGEALLRAISDVDAGLSGDMVRAATGLRILRTLGQEPIARQAAVELMLSPEISGIR